MSYHRNPRRPSANTWCSKGDRSWQARYANQRQSPSFNQERKMGPKVGPI